MSCPKCGNEIPDTSLIAKILRKCPICGALLNYGHEDKVGEKTQFARVGGISYTEKVGGGVR